MEAIRVKTHVGGDGVLRLEMPVGLTNVDCEVTVYVQPEISREEWLRFIDETAGSMADTPIERLPQGASDLRDEIE
jgi:hypothetical protein